MRWKAAACGWKLSWFAEYLVSLPNLHLAAKGHGGSTGSVDEVPSLGRFSAQRGLGQPSLGRAWELPTCPAPALLQVSPLIQNSLCCAARLSPGNISMCLYYFLSPSLTVVPWTHVWIKTNPSRLSIFPFAFVSPLCRCQKWPEFTQFICYSLLTFVLANKRYLH